jgi:hypothetical protein
MHRHETGGKVEHKPEELVANEPYDPWILKVPDYEEESWLYVDSQTWYDPITSTSG